MSVAAIIPARGGSKGIPRKNLQPIGDIPLVGRSVCAALASESVNRVYVSTEDDEIARVAEEYGATAIRRPAELAADETPTLPVIQHALNFMGEPSLVVLLQCTSPFTTAADIDGVMAMLSPEVDMVTSVCVDHSHIVCQPSADSVQWLTRNQNLRRQDMPANYRLTGGVTVYRAGALREAKEWLCGRAGLYVVPAERAVDIDSPVDLCIARALATYGNQWIVAGASPSAREGFAAARAAYPTATTITTNGGQGLFEPPARPDHYLIFDSIACTKHREHAEVFAAHGTRTITLHRDSRRALVDRGVHWFDEFLPVNGAEHPGRFRQGSYASCGLSGLMCLQYALNHGAQGVHLVGMEGYADSGHYFDDQADQGPEKSSRFTRTLIEPFVQSCIDACPDVQFTFYGDLNYRVSGSNAICRK
jgi:CMP-N-acetylneuraminic acid synthetase